MSFKPTQIENINYAGETLKYSALIFRAPFPFSKENYFFEGFNSTLEHGSVERFIEDQNGIKHWKEWLGSLAWEDLLQKNQSILFNSCNTNTPDVLDSENKTLTTSLNNLYHTLPLTGAFSPPQSNPILLTGCARLVDSQLKFLDIRQVQRPTAWTRSFYWTDSPVREFRKNDNGSNSIIKHWEQCASKCDQQAFQANSPQQFCEAYRSFAASFYDEPNLAFKIPNLIRAIECLVGLKKGQGHKFSKRTIHLTQMPSPNEPYELSTKYSEYLTRLYQIRSDCVHGKPFAWSLRSEMGTAFDDKTVAAHEYAAEWAARHAILNAFGNASLTTAASNREALEAYWDSINLDS